jgi:PAS domain S-box-containing protein
MRTWLLYAGLSLASGVGFIYTDVPPLAIWLVSVVAFSIVLGLHGRAARVVRSTLQQAHSELSEQHRVEAALRAREEYLNALIGNIAQVITVLDASGQLQYVSPAAEHILGYSMADRGGRDGFELIHPDDQPSVRASFAQLVQLPQGARTTQELRLQHKNGSWRWLEVTATNQLQLASVQGIVVSYGDITERKHVETLLREREEHYRGAITAAGLVPYIIYYHPRHFSFIGEGILRLSGYTAQEFTPEIMRESIQEYHVSGPNAHLSASEAPKLFLSGDLPEWHCDLRFHTKAGESRWMSDISVAVLDELGKVVGAIGILQDITARKHAENEREQLIKELEAKNAELERFTYTVSHDLKSPLVTMRGFLGYLEKDIAAGKSERVQSDLARIREATDKMRRLLEELLELSRIGRIINAPSRVSFQLIVQEALQLVEGQLTARGVHVTVSPALPMVYGDHVRLVEVMQNLLDNAAKYMGKQATPYVEVGVREGLGDPVFYVGDNGIGIEPKYHEQVFGLFEKLDAHSEGTGVGLALVKRIIEVHGGRIWVESAGEGQGSIFCFTLAQPQT